jgi:hypothetical protein
MKKFLTLPLFLGACFLFSIPIVENTADYKEVAIRKNCHTVKEGRFKGQTFCSGDIIVPIRG